MNERQLVLGVSDSNDEVSTHLAAFIANESHQRRDPDIDPIRNVGTGTSQTNHGNNHGPNGTSGSSSHATSIMTLMKN